MVRFRKTHFYLIWLILLIVLFFTNWVGIRERYLTTIYTTPDVSQVVVGDFDVYKSGLELAYLNPSGIFLIGELTTSSQQSSIYMNSAWDTNPIIALSAGDFDVYHKGDELVALFENGTLISFYLNVNSWESEAIGDLPWVPPEWTTNTMISGQLIENSGSHELAIIGEHFNWTSSVTTGRIFIAKRTDNVTWQINQVHVESNRLLCAAIGDVESSLEGQELVFAGYNTGLISLAYENGTWNSQLMFYWEASIRSLVIGDFMQLPVGYEIAFVKGRDIWAFYKVEGSWIPKQITNSGHIQVRTNKIIVEDIDPYNAGHELLAVGSALGNARPILVILSYNSLEWNSRILWNLVEIPQEIVVSNFDFNRDGAEVIVANKPMTAILAVPNMVDRNLRAGLVVIVPAILLMPATILIFALADYIGRAGDRRRRDYALRMVAKGFVRCARCKRFIPKDKIEAHRNWHRREQFR